MREICFRYASFVQNIYKLYQADGKLTWAQLNSFWPVPFDNDEVIQILIWFQCSEVKSYFTVLDIFLIGFNVITEIAIPFQLTV